MIARSGSLVGLVANGLGVLMVTGALSGCMVLAPEPEPRPVPEEAPEVGPEVTPEPDRDAVPPPPERPLPRVEVEQLAEREGPPLGVPVMDPVRAPAGGERVTLTAVATELRPLLAALAQAAGVNLIVGSAVQGRVTVHFVDVPAAEALEQVVRESGYMIVRPLERPYPPTVFYVVPVNVNEADAATIQARFGVSSELAEYLVRVRIPPN